MFQSYFHIHLWSIWAINTTWCQKCFKSETDPRVHIHIHPSNFQRREGEKSKHPNLQDTYTKGTLLLSSIPDHKQQQNKALLSTIHIHFTICKEWTNKPCHKEFPLLVLRWTGPKTTKSIKDTYCGDPVQKKSFPAYYPKNLKQKSLHIFASGWEMMDNYS